MTEFSRVGSLHFMFPGWTILVLNDAGLTFVTLSGNIFAPGLYSPNVAKLTWALEIPENSSPFHILLLFVLFKVLITRQAEVWARMALIWLIPPCALLCGHGPSSGKTVSSSSPLLWMKIISWWKHRIRNLSVYLFLCLKNSDLKQTLFQATWTVGRSGVLDESMFSSLLSKKIYLKQRSNLCWI